MDGKKMFRFWWFSMVVGLYTTLVIQNLWNWFVVAALHVSSLSYWQTYGMVLMVGLAFGSSIDFGEDPRWRVLSIGLDACVPEDKRKALDEALKTENDMIWVAVGYKIVGRLTSSSVIFGLGWAVHMFLV